jgi:hypothetical protein
LWLWRGWQADDQPEGGDVIVAGASASDPDSSAPNDLHPQHRGGQRQHDR